MYKSQQDSTNLALQTFCFTINYLTLSLLFSAAFATPPSEQLSRQLCSFSRYECMRKEYEAERFRKECVFSVIPLEKYRYRKTFPQIQSVSPWLQAVIVSWWLAQFLLSSYWTFHKWHSGKVHVLLVLLERMNLPHKAFIAEPCYLSCSDPLSSMVANQVLFGTVVAHWQLYACLLYECQPVRTDTDCL